MDKPLPRRGPWTLVSAREVYRNPWISVTDHEVIRPDGLPGQYGVVSFAHLAVGILPISEDGRVRLVGQHRFPHDAYSWEVPEGGGEPDETPLDAAKRELAEETGLLAESWTPLIEMDLSNSVTDEKAVCFLATGLTEGEAAPDPDEALEVRSVPFSELLGDVLAGRVRDSMTVAMVLAAHTRASRGELDTTLARLILDQ